MAARSARAHQETNSRARRRRVKFFAQLSRKKAGRALVPGGHRSALGLRCRVGRCWTSATGRQHPRRQPRRGAAPPRSYSVSKRRKVEKASGGRLFAGNPRRGALVPSGHRSALGLRCRVGRCWTSATGRQHPRRQPRLPDWAVRSSVVTAVFPCHPAQSVCRPLV